VTQGHWFGSDHRLREDYSSEIPDTAASAEPLGGDFDGDGAPDAIFVDKSNYTWHVRFSKDGTAHSFSFADGGDVPVH
jgi:hypothetical protein